MGLSAGSVTIGLGADYGSLERDLGKARQSLGKFGRNASQSLAPMLMMQNAFGGNALFGDITRAATAMWGFAEAIKAAGIAMKTVGAAQLGGAAKGAAAKALAETQRRFREDRESILNRSIAMKGWQKLRDIQTGKQSLKTIMTDEGPMTQTIEGVKEAYGLNRPAKPKAAVSGGGAMGGRGAMMLGGIGLAGIAGAGAIAAIPAQRAMAERQLAESLNTTVAALDSLQLAARKNGIEEAKVAEMLGKIATVSSQAAAGMGEAQNAFKMLGIDAKAIAGMGADQQMFKVADALRNMQDPTVRAGLAAKMFGESAARAMGFILNAETQAKQGKWMETFSETGKNSLTAMIPSWTQFTEKISIMGNNIAGVFADIWRVGEPLVNIIANIGVFISDVIVRVTNALAGLAEWIYAKLGWEWTKPAEAAKGTAGAIGADMTTKHDIGSGTVINRSLVDVSGYAANSIASQQLAEQKTGNALLATIASQTRNLGLA